MKTTAEELARLEAKLDRFMNALLEALDAGDLHSLRLVAKKVRQMLAKEAA